MQEEILACERKQLFKKHEAYAYEREYRLVIDFLEHAAEKRVDREFHSGININFDVFNVLDEIIISPFADSWFMELVSDVIDDFGIKPKVRWSSLKYMPHESFSGNVTH